MDGTDARNARAQSISLGPREAICRGHDSELRVKSEGSDGSTLPQEPATCLLSPRTNSFSSPSRISRNIGSADRPVRRVFLIYIPDLDANILGLAEKGNFLRFVFEEAEMPVPARGPTAKQHRRYATIILGKGRSWTAESQLPSSPLLDLRKSCRYSIA